MCETVKAPCWSSRATRFLLFAQRARPCPGIIGTFMGLHRLSYWHNLVMNCHQWKVCSPAEHFTSHSPLCVCTPHLAVSSIYCSLWVCTDWAIDITLSLRQPSTAAPQQCNIVKKKRPEYMAGAPNIYSVYIKTLKYILVNGTETRTVGGRE